MPTIRNAARHTYQQILDELVQEDDLHAPSLQRDLNVKCMHVEIFLSFSGVIVQRQVQLEYVVAHK